MDILGCIIDNWKYVLGGIIVFTAGYMLISRKKDRPLSKKRKYKQRVPLVDIETCRIDNDKGISPRTYSFLGRTKWEYHHTDKGDDYITVSTDCTLDTPLDEKEVILTDGSLMIRTYDEDTMRYRIATMTEEEFKANYEAI